jgi:hypothetical protein
MVACCMRFVVVVENFPTRLITHIICAHIYIVMCYYYQIIALLNTLAQFSSSVNAVNEWKQREAMVQLVYMVIMGTIAFIAVVTVLVKVLRMLTKKKSKSS